MVIEWQWQALIQWSMMMLTSDIENGDLHSEIQNISNHPNFYELKICYFLKKLRCLVVRAPVTYYAPVLITYAPNSSVSFHLQDNPVRTITYYFRFRPFSLSEVLLIIHGKTSLNFSQVPLTSAKDACSMKQKGISWILTEKISKPSPFSFYVVWFDKYHVVELVFERAFLEVFLDVISNSELFQGLFMITTGVAEISFVGVGGRSSLPEMIYYRISWVSGRPPVFLV